jgi:hypothetical protein
MAAAPANQARTRRPWVAIIAIALTATACLLALFLREPITARWWAARLAASDDDARRATYLGALCNAGDSAHWGVAALMRSDDPDLRQYGVLACQQIRTPWSRRLLRLRMADTDPYVRRMAAVALASHGDDAVIPTLKHMYRNAEGTTATVVAVALERLGTPAARAALDELVHAPADAAHRAALIEALANLGGAESVPPLLFLLEDDRRCRGPVFVEELAQHLYGPLIEQGFRLAEPTWPATRPAQRTVAEHAADALAKITGEAPPFASDASSEQRAAAAHVWRQWYEAQVQPPPHAPDSPAERAPDAE